MNFLNWKLLLKKPLPETDVTFLVPNMRSENGKKKLTVRNLCDYLTDLNTDIPSGNYIFKVNNRNTRARCEICSKLQRHKRRSGVFLVNLEYVSHLGLVFLLLTLIRQMPAVILDNRKINSKHLGHKGLHFNKACSTRLEKTLFISYRNFDGL